MCYDTNCNFVGNVPWRMCARIEQTDDFNLCLGFYLKCEEESEFVYGIVFFEIKVLIVKYLVKKKFKLKQSSDLNELKNF